MHTGNSSPTGLWWISVIGAAGKASFDLFPFAMSRNSSVYSCKVVSRATSKNKVEMKKKRKKRTKAQNTWNISGANQIKLEMLFAETIKRAGKKSRQLHLQFKMLDALSARTGTYNERWPIHGHVDTVVVGPPFQILGVVRVVDCVVELLIDLRNPESNLVASFIRCKKSIKDIAHKPWILRHIQRLVNIEQNALKEFQAGLFHFLALIEYRRHVLHVNRIVFIDLLQRLIVFLSTFGHLVLCLLHAILHFLNLQNDSISKWQNIRVEWLLHAKRRRIRSWPNFGSHWERSEQKEWKIKAFQFKSFQNNQGRRVAGFSMYSKVNTFCKRFFVEFYHNENIDGGKYKNS